MGSAVRKVLAFVTDEYPLFNPDGGGLATYVEKTAKQFVTFGYEVHVFLPGKDDSLLNDEGVVIHLVSNPFPKLSWWLIRFSPKITCDFAGLLVSLFKSYGLANKVSEYERDHGHFSLVQSCDFQFRGLFVKLSKRRKLIVRCSWARDLFEGADGVAGLYPSVSAFLERLSMRRADFVYAPSKFVSQYYVNKFKINVHLIRPPAPVFSVVDNGDEYCVGQERCIFHFGQLCRRKGTDFVISVARKMRGSGVQFIMAGVLKEADLLESMNLAGIKYLGPISRSQVHALLRKGAVASFLPSRVDNLPNTAIESLALGVPVITVANNGVDELIDQGVNGWVLKDWSVNQASEVLLEVVDDFLVERKSVALTAEFSHQDSFSALKNLMS